MEPLDFSVMPLNKPFRSSFTITEELNRAYVCLIEDHTPVNRKAPNYIFNIFNPIYQAIGGRMDPAAVHLRQKTVHYEDVFIGDEIGVMVEFTEKYMKKSREYLLMEVKFLKNNRVVCKNQMTLLLNAI